MSIIEEAAKRLRQLEEAGIAFAAQASANAREAEVRPSPLSRAPRLNLNLARLRANGYITSESRDSKLLHEFRLIKRPLIRYATGKNARQTVNPNLIMVTSALPAEGKTFVAVNLAMSMAMELDCRVLLVDADIISPSLPDALGVELGKGLMDLLADGASSFPDVLLGTNVERLTLLPAGTPQAGAAELLASEAMARLLAEMSSRYPDRIVVFDSPPLLATSESRVLANHVGQVVLVVEAGRTTHTALESALATVEACPAVYTVLNKAPESKGASYYGPYAQSR
jgi:receptor protein-tyrosine kinase